MIITLSELKSRVLELAIICLPLESFGYISGEFVFNPSLFLIIIFTFLNLFSSKFNYKTFLLILIFISYLLFISIIKNNDFNFIFSYLLFVINFSFLIFDSSKLKLNLFRSIKISLLVSVLIVGLDIIIPDFNTYFSSFQYPRRIGQNVYQFLPFDRFTSGFSESSNYGSYLFLMYFLYNYQSIKSKSFEILIFCLVMLSQSFTAYFLFFVFLFVTKFKFTKKSSYYYLIPVLSLFLYSSFDRIVYIFSSFNDLSYYTSFGRRFLSIYLIFSDFLDYGSFLTGYGFENQQIQLIDKFKYWNIDLTEGWIHNILINLLLVGGIISIFFLFLIIKHISNRNTKFIFINIFLIVLISFVSGRLSYWFYWLPLFLTPYFIYNENKVFK